MNNWSLLRFGLVVILRSTESAGCWLQGLRLNSSQVM